jgi:hypothetical protein
MALLDDRSADPALDQIRPRSRQVAQQAQHVGVVRERIQALAQEFKMPPGVDGIGWPVDGDRLMLGKGLDTLAFLITVETVRFGSGYHPQMARRQGHSVGQSILAGLKEHFEKHGPLKARQLAAATTADCAELFGQDAGNPAHAELMDLFARAFRDLGQLLLDEFDGSFEEMVASAEGSAVRLVDILLRMPFYVDVQRYSGLAVPFLLRAQRVVVDLAQAFQLEGPGRFTDLDVLAPSADSLVAHVLRMEGVLHYTRGLAERIDRGEPVPAHTEREVEIRACTIHAVELLTSVVRQQDASVTTLHVDTWLRRMGRAASYRAKPRHRSRTVLY